MSNTIGNVNSGDERKGLPRARLHTAVERCVGMPNAESLCALEGRIDWRQTLFTPLVSVMSNASQSAVVSMRMPAESKARFGALAARHGLTESGLLSRLVDEVLRSNAPNGEGGAARDTDRAHDAEGPGEQPAEDRITLRLRTGDRARAAQLASARGMKTSSYLALLIHNHVRTSDVMPPRELDLLKAAGAQLAALGRQLRMFDMPNTPTELATSELRDLLAHVRHDVEIAREALAAVVRRNLMSWEAGHA